MSRIFCNGVCHFVKIFIAKRQTLLFVHFLFQVGKKGSVPVAPTKVSSSAPRSTTPSGSHAKPSTTGNGVVKSHATVSSSASKSNTTMTKFKKKWQIHWQLEVVCTGLWLQPLDLSVCVDGRQSGNVFWCQHKMQTEVPWPSTPLPIVLMNVTRQITSVMLNGPQDPKWFWPCKAVWCPQGQTADLVHMRCKVALGKWCLKSTAVLYHHDQI